MTRAAVHGQVDVIGTGPPEESRYRTGRYALLGALLAAVALGAAGGVLVTRAGQEAGQVAAEEAGRGTLPLTGSVVLRTFDTRQGAPAFGLGQDRDGIARGRMVLELPDGEQLRGIVRLDYDASFVDGPETPDVLHSWGTLTVRLEETTCTGTFGWSFLRAPAESGGALQLRCQDGAVLGAQMVRSAEEVPGLAADLRDGWYLAG